MLMGRIGSFVLAGLVFGGCAAPPAEHRAPAESAPDVAAGPADSVPPEAPPSEAPGDLLARAAREQIGVTVHYDPSYRSIEYPNGDIPADRGVCTDVVIRAYRRLGVDLQVLVHEDMREAFGEYPNAWGLARPDPNIDHRRVLNLAVFFRRHGQELSSGASAEEFQPGDLVTWRLPSGAPHIGVVSDARSPSGTPLIVHNLSRGVLEEDILFAFPITGHFRFHPPVMSINRPAPPSV